MTVTVNEHGQRLGFIWEGRWRHALVYKGDFDAAGRQRVRLSARP